MIKNRHVRVIYLSQIHPLNTCSALDVFSATLNQDLSTSNGSVSIGSYIERYTWEPKCWVFFLDTPLHI